MSSHSSGDEEGNADPIRTQTTASLRASLGGKRKLPKLQDWAEHWPFPQFDKKPARPSSATMPGGRNARSMSMSSAVSMVRSASSSEDDEQVDAIKPHPLSSDWNLEPVNSRKSQPSRAVSISGMLRMASDVGSTSSAAPPVSRDEIAAVRTLVEQSTDIGCRLQMNHLNLKWLRRDAARRIVPPPVHLHLENLERSLAYGAVKRGQILINSPRSAVVLLRRGVELSSLIPCERPRPRCTAPSRLTWDQKKDLATERIRQTKLHEVVSEYKSVARKLSFDDFVDLYVEEERGCCQNMMMHESPSRSVPCEKMPASSKSGQRQQQLQGSLSSSFASLLQRHRRREARIHRSQLRVRQMKEEHCDRVVQEILEKEKRCHTAMGRVNTEREVAQRLNKGKEELWAAQRHSHDKATTFREAVVRERLQRRLRGVTALQEAKDRSLFDFHDSLRRLNAEEHLRNAQEQSSFLTRARKAFLQTQH